MGSIRKLRPQEPGSDGHLRARHLVGGLGVAGLDLELGRREALLRRGDRRLVLGDRRGRGAGLLVTRQLLLGRGHGLAGLLDLEVALGDGGAVRGASARELVLRALELLLRLSPRVGGAACLDVDVLRARRCEALDLLREGDAVRARRNTGDLDHAVVRVVVAVLVVADRIAIVDLDAGEPSDAARSGQRVSFRQWRAGARLLAEPGGLRIARRTGCRR